MRALLVVLLLLLGLLVFGDREAVGIAEDRVASQLAEAGDLAGPPEVEASRSSPRRSAGAMTTCASR